MGDHRALKKHLLTIAMDVSDRKGFARDLDRVYGESLRYLERL